jgi:hypothetical protein
MISVLQQAELPAPPQEATSGVISGVTDEQGEFEIVMGRGQVASTMLLVLVLLVVFSAGAYVVGKSTVPKPAAQAAASVPAPPPVPVVKVEQPVAQPIAQVSAPLYGDPVQGKVYLQVGAVEKGLAGVWAEGLRTHALDAFVAPGPSDKMWRVVIGPLPNPEAYMRAKEVLDQLGINTFGRRYEAPAAAKVSEPLPVVAAQ